MLTNANHFRSWRLINYRSINDVVSAEFLHELYNRYLPIINPVRFRNTICIYKGTEFYSYAPKKEWDMLEKILGARLYHNEADLVYKLRGYIGLEKKELHHLLNELEKKSCQMTTIR